MSYHVPLAKFWVSVLVLLTLLGSGCAQGNQIQQLLIQICSERMLEVSEVLIDCAARVYGVKDIHSKLRDCVLVHIGAKSPEAEITVTPSAVPELCNMTNVHHEDNDVDIKDEEIDKVVPYRAGSTLYCALANVKISPNDLQRAYNACQKHFQRIVGETHGHED
ncbi:uncharacterized protein LOC135401082 isoform X2 [Ornithodoros turicata]|uniref:uncharacterized protein LOC135401082 isoform X2 n=1 Tax=Ornithodoros turicata TaxID=34597 RepID=UPI00313A2904